MRSPLAGACGPGDPLTTTPRALGPPPGYLPHDLPRLSDRITLLDGAELTELEVDAIVRWTDNSLTSDDAVYRAVSTQLQQHLLSRVHDRQLGGVVVTPAFSLPCRYIVHAVVAPRTGNAARDTALMHQAYRGALNKAVELGAQSVAMGLAEVSRHHSQLDHALRILLCSAGSELARHGGLRVVLVAPPGLQPRLGAPCSCVYQFPLPEQDSKLDLKLGDRRIRIIHNPQANDSSEDESSLYEERGATAEAAAAMLACMDTQPLLAATPRLPLQQDDEDQLETYESLLRRAQTEDLSSISGIGCLYQSGVDRLGRPVVIFIGKWFPFKDIDLEKAMLYLIKLLDPIVRGDYVIAYFHTMSSSANNPPFGWLRDVYTVLPYKYKKNLKAFYIVHPTFWTKMMTWWFTTFMAPAIKAKVHSLPGVEFLYSVMARDQLEVPAFITEYDMTINGLHYFQPDTNNT